MGWGRGDPICQPALLVVLWELEAITKRRPPVVKVKSPARDENDRFATAYE